jgi:hypothetical protein
MELPAERSSRHGKRWNMDHPRDRLVRLTGTVLAFTFAAVGAVFLLIPDRVLALFNAVGDVLGLPASPTDAFTLYLALAVAYMYIVTLLAVQTARRPRITAYPWLLVQAKAASALICLVLFIAQDHYLIYLANAVVDGTIAAAVWAIAVRGASHGDALLAMGDEVEDSRATHLRRTAS